MVSSFPPLYGGGLRILRASNSISNGGEASDGLEYMNFYNLHGQSLNITNLCILLNGLLDFIEWFIAYALFGGFFHNTFCTLFEEPRYLYIFFHNFLCVNTLFVD